jgi:alkanesulfonate monooxygenase SsuD/methylene tetrahydromethanopterin reductase-like flavin-dependent oxidoreductase (luciferase family)
MTGIFFGRDLDALDRQLESERVFRPELAATPRDELIAIMRQRNVIVGTPETVKEQISAYVQAGAEELMLQWLDQDDIEGLRALAEVVRGL